MLNYLIELTSDDHPEVEEADPGCGSGGESAPSQEVEDDHDDVEDEVDEPDDHAAGAERHGAAAAGLDIAAAAHDGDSVKGRRASEEENIFCCQLNCLF